MIRQMTWTLKSDAAVLRRRIAAASATSIARASAALRCGSFGSICRARRKLIQRARAGLGRQPRTRRFQHACSMQVQSSNCCCLPNLPLRSNIMSPSSPSLQQTWSSGNPVKTGPASRDGRTLHLARAHGQTRLTRVRRKQVPCNGLHVSDCQSAVCWLSFPTSSPNKQLSIGSTPWIQTQVGPLQQAAVRGQRLPAAGCS
jgi:hypothetical protein